MIAPKKKLIEVALPLASINKASVREKSIRHGHPSTLHLWWSRKPTATARAVIFAQMVDDPSAHPELFPTEKAQEDERQRLFRIIEELVLWENTTNEEVLVKARDEIQRSWQMTCSENAGDARAQELFEKNKLPGFHDPFAGGGSIPLEAQRLGLESYASDLNPVAVLINKAMIEIPPRFAGRPPVNPVARGKTDLIGRTWIAAHGLANDVRYYGNWMRDEAAKRIGFLYPRMEVTPGMSEERPDLRTLVGQKLGVIAWIWVRTVKSPNPAFSKVDVPLAPKFWLSSKAGKEAYIEPIIEGSSYRFTVRVGKPKDIEAANNGTKLSRGANFRCVMSGTPITQDHIRGEFREKRGGARLMAVVADGVRGRVYLPPTTEMEDLAFQAKPAWKPEAEMNQDCKDLLSGRGYGFKYWHELFTSRQLTGLTTFCDLVQAARTQVKRDALAAGWSNDTKGIAELGDGATAYADALALYLAFGVSRLANRLATICVWNRIGEKIEQVFARQAIPMTWDFPEANVFSESTGGWAGSLEWVPTALETLPVIGQGIARQENAAVQAISQSKVVSTDPPYYDNIGYADLSDYFYIWLRGSLKSVFPDLFNTLAVPKAEELVATAFRHGGKAQAESFFLDGMTKVIHRLAEQVHPAFPVTIYYAFKQSESEGDGGTSSTGWETFLDAVIRAGFAITGTWPMRTERDFGVKSGTNVLASSVLLVCRPRAIDAPTVTRREFISNLKAELPNSLHNLQHGNIAPVDLAQAAIGPGMAIYTRFSNVLNTEGTPLSVREALVLINQTLDEVLAEQEGDFDADSRWALAWFDQHGFAEGEYGLAEILSKAKNTSISGMVESGILSSSRGKVRLLRPSELPPDWDPAKDKRLVAWEIVHRLVQSLERGGEGAAAELAARLGNKVESARDLAYRLYTLCERKKRAQESLSYNALVQSWLEIAKLSRESKKPGSEQTKLFLENEE